MIMLPEIVLVGALSGLVQGLSGFAFGLIATALWAWMMEPQMVVPMVALGSLVGQIVSVHSVRRDVERARLAPFIIGGALGVPLGTLLLQQLSVPVFRTGVGIILVAYCSTMLWVTNLPRVRSGGRPADGFIGFVAGVMNGLSALAGPPMILWCALRGWSKGVQRATFQPFFIFVQLLALGLFVWQGTLDLAVLRIFLWVGPVIVLSSWIGSRFARRFSDLRFQRLVFLLLVVSGLSLLAPLIGRALRGLGAG
jgi:uncharacterized protein